MGLGERLLRAPCQGVVQRVEAAGKVQTQASQAVWVGDNQLVPALRTLPVCIKAGRSCWEGARTGVINYHNGCIHTPILVLTFQCRPP